jgi:transcriptional regulator CtsR
MPIKEKEKCLIKISNKPYKDIREFLEDIFYKDDGKNLSKQAYEIMRMIYDRKESGLQAKNWKEHIKNVFGCAPVAEEESSELKKIYGRFHKVESSRGKKPYLAIIKQVEEGKAQLPEAEKELLKKAIKWNSSVSTYYSVLKKLVATGLVEKREGKYFRSSKLLEQFKHIEKIISDFETLIRS